MSAGAAAVMEATAPKPLVLAHAEAVKIGKVIVDALDEYCDEIAFAGALRRGCSQVDAIDLVCLPKSSRDGDALITRLLRKARMVDMADRTQAILLYMPQLGGDVRLNVVKARHAAKELFGGDPGNWGIRLMMCTGNHSHNIRLRARAEDRGFTLDVYRGILDATGRVLASATEAEIYQVLGLRFYEPAERERPDF